jgi:hypothetical protein
MRLDMFHLVGLSLVLESFCNQEDKSKTQVSKFSNIRLKKSKVVSVLNQSINQLSNQSINQLLCH